MINAIDPAKDVDGFHISNVGLLSTGQKSMVPCTPLGCLMMLRDHLGSLSGLDAVVIGRSNIVGKPMAQLLLGDSCTVTIAHSRTKDLAGVVRRADIVVAAVGRANFVQGDWVKRGATVIDVGINRIPAPERGEGRSRLVGDVDFDAVKEIAGAITPVPGGVGPMTIACLLANTLTACCRRSRLCRARGADGLSTRIREALRGLFLFQDVRSESAISIPRLKLRNRYETSVANILLLLSRNIPWGPGAWPPEFEAGGGFSAQSRFPRQTCSPRRDQSGPVSSDRGDLRNCRLKSSDQSKNTG